MRIIGRILLVLLVIVLIIGAVMFFRWQARKADDPDATFVLPRLHVAELHMEEFDMENTRMHLVMRIDQPAPVPLDLDSLSYVIYIDTVEIARSAFPHDISIPAMGSATVASPFISRTNDLTAVLKRLEEQGVDSVDHVLVATFHSPLMFWKMGPAEVRIVEHLPAYRIPKVSLHRPRIEKFGFNESRIMVDLAIFNPNPFAYNFEETSVELKMRDEKVLSTRIDSLIHIPIKDTVVIRVPLELSPGRTLRTAWDYLFNAPTTNYEFSLYTTIVSKSKSIDGGRFRMMGEGTLDEVKK
jgi:LEA14-like dessication related protein